MADIILTHPDGLKTKWIDLGGGIYAQQLYLAGGATITVSLATLPDTAAGDLAAINAALAGTLTAQLSGNLPDTAAGDLAAINAAVAGTLTVDATGQGNLPTTPNDGLAATRAGNGVCKWANEVTPGATETVLTTAGLIYNIPSGKRVMLTQYCYAVETTSDDCQFEIGCTDQVNGGGTFTPLGPHKHVYTGAANSGRTAYDQEITPPEPITYSSGARCITFRVDANDSGCQVTVGWHGWVEDE